MLRLLLLLLAVLVLVAAFTPRQTRHATLAIVAGLVLLYVVLKLTGVIEGVAPNRAGVS